MAARGATPLAGDLDDGAALAGIFARAGCDALVNLASLGFGHAPGIVRAAVRAGLDRAVFVSTTAVTTTLPARSKTVRLAAEDEIRGSEPELDDPAADDDLRRAPVTGTCPGCLRCSRGCGALPVPLVVPVPGGGRQLQQPVHVADLAGAVLTAVERPAAAGRRYDVAGPEPLTFAERAARLGGRGRRPGRVSCRCRWRR